MAIGKGSMARASKAVKTEVKDAAKVEVKAEEQAKVEAPVKVETTKKVAAKKAPAKKAPVKKPVAKKEPTAAVVTPTKQVMDMVVKDRVEVGDEMPIYFY